MWLDMRINKIKESNYFKNTSYSFVGKVVAMGFYMLLDIVCARMLDVEMYAEWVFFFSILTIMFYIGWLGINTSTKVFVSKQIGREKRGACISGAVVLRFIGSIFICILIFSIVFSVAPKLGYPDKYPDLLKLLLIAPIIVFFNSFCEFFKEIFMGIEEFKKLFFITIVEYGGYFIFSTILLMIFRSVESVAIGYVCSGIVIFLTGFFILKKALGKTLNIKAFRNYKEYINAIMKYAIPIAIIAVGGLVLIEMDTFMLGILSNKEQVATYGIAKNLCSKATHINYALTVGTMTSFSVLTIENIKQKKQKFLKISNLNILIATLVSSIFWVIGPLLIKLLYGENYRLAGDTLKFLIPYYILYSISNFFSTFLDFQGKAKFRSACYVSIIIINLILNCILIPMYGARGAAIATSVSLVPYTVMVIIGTVRIYMKFEKQVD